MSRLYSFRGGWESENLGKYILSRISFIAQPTSVSDDLGSDLFCTIFKTIKINKRKYLIPKNSITIQIKSNTNLIAADSNIDYLNDLELPYFVGVVNKKDLSISIFSGVYLSWMFSYVGKIESLKIKLVEKDIKDPISPIAPRKLKYIIRFPFICKIFANSSVEELQRNVDTILQNSLKSLENISTRINNEYIFSWRENKISILAGSGSARTYKVNFVKRLVECFCNIDWLVKNTGKVSDQLLKEFKIYENIYFQLLEVNILDEQLLEFIKGWYNISNETVIKYT
jgi:hypothetical protein